MFIPITTLQEYNQLVEQESALLFYFSTDECQVCKVLKPKVEQMVDENFPNMKLVYINLNQAPDIAAQNRIFTVPTLQVIFDRHEYIRKSRNFGVNELKSEILRPYGMMFL